MSDLVGAALSCMQAASADLPGLDLAHKPLGDIAARDAKHPAEQSRAVRVGLVGKIFGENIFSLKEERCSRNKWTVVPIH